MLVFTGQFTTGGSTVRAKLEMYMFQEDGVYIVYCPALDLSAYGQNEEEARKAFEQTFEMHFTYCINKKSLYEDLKKHGWTIKGKKQKKDKNFLVCRFVAFYPPMDPLKYHSFFKTA